MSSEVSNKVLTLPNLISLIRLLLVPVFGVLLVVYQNNVAAFVVFLIAASTDFLDGAIARSTGQVSRLGQQLDPLVDRVLILTAVILVFIVGRVPLWILLLLVARDVSMLILIARMRAAGQQAFSVALVGKAATALNMAGFCLLILNWPEVGGLGIIDSGALPGWGASAAPLGIWFVYFGTTLAWAAGIYYIVRAQQATKQLNNSYSSSSANAQALRQAQGAQGAQGTQGAQARRAAQTQVSGSSSARMQAQPAHYTRRAEADPSMHDQAGVHSGQQGRSGAPQRGAQQRGYAASTAQQSTAQQRGHGSSSQQSGVPRRGTQQRGAQQKGYGSGAQGSGSRGSGSQGRGRGSNTAQGQGNTAQGQGAAAAVIAVLDTPKKLYGALVVVLLLIVMIVFYSIDGISNFGVIHSGVRVGAVEVGHTGQDEAAALLTAELTTLANSAPVTFYANQEAADAGVQDTTQQIGNGINVYNQTEVDHTATSWSASLATFDAEVNGSKLAEEAYGIGRYGDYFLGRLAASTFGVTVTPQADFSLERLRNLENMLTQTIGTPMQNATVAFDGSRLVAHDGQDGNVVDEEQFITLLQKAFFSDEREFVVPLVEQKMNITLEDAQAAAESAQLALSSTPVRVSYGDDSWELTAAQMGGFISTSVEQDESGSWNLSIAIDAQLLEDTLPQITGHIEDQVAPLDAEFVVIDGALQVTPSQNGTGVDYSRLANDLNALLFNQEGQDGQDASSNTANSTASNTSASAEPKDVLMYIGVLEPELLTSDAAAYDFSSKISEFTIEYPWVGQGTVTNIHVASDLINSSIIAPQGTWSFNEAAGECTADKGFVEAQIILGNAYVDEIGGGVCNVASTVYNTAYEAGYPIVERINHSLRLTRYPVGRDAAIAYPYADLKFQNDTENYLLLTMSYTDATVTCTLWGIPPGYKVESVTGDLVEGADFKTQKVDDPELKVGEEVVDQEGKKASKVEVTRTVYYADGTLKEKRTFSSSYDPTPEIIKVGPKE